MPVVDNIKPGDELFTGTARWTVVLVRPDRFPAATVDLRPAPPEPGAANPFAPFSVPLALIEAALTARALEHLPRGIR